MAGNDDVTFDTFQQHYIDLVNDDNIFSNWRNFQTQQNMCDIRSFIVQTDSFRNRVSNMLTKLYPIMSDGLPRQDEVFTYCLDHFKKTTQFSVQKLTDILQSLIVSTDTDTLDELAAYPLVCDNINSTDVACSTEDLGICQGLLPLSHASKITSFITQYEQVMGRSMFAHELVILAQYIDKISIEDVVNNVKGLYTVVSDTVMRYEGRHVTEHEFSREYLNTVFLKDHEMVRDDLVHTMMRGDVYNCSMRDRIRSKLRLVLGQTPDDVDVEYAFNHAVDGKMHLLDDGIDDLLIRLLEETRNQRDNIRKVYQDTYGRCPDDAEISQRVAEYRRSTAFSSISEQNETLRKELCDDLEYHDVIRQLIEDELGDVALPRIVFSTMKQLLKEFSPLWDTENLQQYIQIKTSNYQKPEKLEKEVNINC